MLSLTFLWNTFLLKGMSAKKTVFSPDITIFRLAFPRKYIPRAMAPTDTAVQEEEEELLGLSLHSPPGLLQCIFLLFQGWRHRLASNLTNHLQSRRWDSDALGSRENSPLLFQPVYHPPLHFLIFLAKAKNGIFVWELPINESLCSKPPY